ncbi:YciI family protein [Polaromonas aquatica]|uniref:YciI family protein n=1 Tax=Polaromonas aquatica TaxID=332657 RepID=A0ABW1TSE6_9BURK
MKYLCLAYYDPAEFAAMSPADMKALVSQCPPKDAQLKATGRLRLSASLGEPATAIRLQPRSGKTQRIDGPFTEAKELVGGFFIIEAANPDEAVKAASLHPAATLGEGAGWRIDMHPIGFFEQYEGKA